jgi:hypothetical protein
MAKLTIKSGTWYVLLLLVVLLALLPILKATAPSYFPTQGFSNPNYPSYGCTPGCVEGQFCGGGNQCVPIGTRYPNAVPTGNV